MAIPSVELGDRNEPFNIRDRIIQYVDISYTVSSALLLLFFDCTADQLLYQDAGFLFFAFYPR